MSDGDTRLQLAEDRLDRIQGILDDVRRVIDAAEKAQQTADRARTELRKVSLLVLGGLAILAILLVVSRKAHPAG
jgi:hypothetical protein